MVAVGGVDMMVKVVMEVMELNLDALIAIDLVIPRKSVTPYVASLSINMVNLIQPSKCNKYC